MQKLIKILFDQDYKIVVEVSNGKKSFESIDDFLVRFVKYYSSSDPAAAGEVEKSDGSRQARTIRLLVFRGPAPYTKLRQLLTTCNFLSQIYKIPIAGFSADKSKPQFHLKPILPSYIK